MQARASASSARTDIDAKWIQHSFTELRKASNHPLLLPIHYKGERLQRIASVLESEAHFGPDASFEKIMQEISSYSDLQLHLACCEYKALSGRSYQPTFPPHVIKMAVHSYHGFARV